MMIRNIFFKITSTVNKDYSVTIHIFFQNKISNITNL